MRKACINAVYEMAKEDPRVFFLGSDLGYKTLESFRREIPERFIVEGISEANLVGMAAGLALEGKIPYLNTIATFLARRAYEQIAVDLAMHNLPVRLIGNGGGLVYAPLGSTHLAIEDISIMRALPNMSVVCPADAEEMKRLMAQTLDYPGPLYIRLGKGYDEVVSKEENGFTLGRAIQMRAGQDALLVTTGVCLQEALQAAELLQGQGIEVAILHMHTVKPLDQEQFLDLAASVKAVVAIEENSIVGGLGAALAEVLCESAKASGTRFRRMGIPDIFPDFYGTQKEIMARFQLSGQGICQVVTELLNDQDW